MTPKTKDAMVIQPILHVPAKLGSEEMPMPPVMNDITMPNLIGDKEEDESTADVFCFEAFEDKHNGVVYYDLTGAFFFKLLESCVCFLSCVITNQTLS